jgi:hypothetical protein
MFATMMVGVDDGGDDDGGDDKTSSIKNNDNA